MCSILKLRHGMGDTVVDRAGSECSDGMAFNRQSWADQDLEEEEKRATSSTPLLGKCQRRSDGLGARRGEEGSGPAIGESFSDLLESGEERPGLFVVRRTVFGEVLVANLMSYLGLVNLVLPSLA